MALIVNGPAAHDHLLLSMPAANSVADLLRVLKTNSCRWVHEQFRPGSTSAGRRDTARAFRGREISTARGVAHSSYAPWRGLLDPSTHPTACAVGHFLSPFGLSVRLQARKM